MRKKERAGAPTGLLGECVSIVVAGIGLRWRAMREATASLALGWEGDLRYSARSLMRSPWYALVTTVTLAFGIGANAAVFGLARSVLFTPPPLDAPEQLVLIWNTLGASPDRVRVPAPDVAYLEAAVSGLDGIAFMNRVTDAGIESRDGVGVAHVRLALVTPNLFNVLGVSPSFGRGFRPDDTERATSEDGVTAPPVVLLSDGLWRSAYGADPGLLGRSVLLDGRPVTVVGVLPPGFRVPMPPAVGIAAEADVWVPLRIPLADLARTDGRRVDQDSDNTGAVIARLRAGMTLAEVNGDLNVLASEMKRDVPGYGTADVGLIARSLTGDATEHIRPLLTALVAGVAVVLLVTCLNLATLVLARGTQRTTELAVRSALGAGQARLVRQLATEGMFLVLIGTMLALLVGTALAAAMEGWGNGLGLASGRVLLDPVVLFVSALLATLTTVSAGVVPALKSIATEGRGGIVRGIRADRRGDRTVRDILVVAQIALSVVLLLGAAMLVRTVSALKSVDPGFEANGAMTFALSLRSPDRYRSPGDRARLMQEIAAEIGALPGVQAVGLTTQLPLSGRLWTQPYGLPGQAPAEWAANRADFRAITSGYFDAMGTTLLEGRTFNSFEDLNEDRRVVVIDEALARRVSPTGSAVGRTLGFPLDGDQIQAEIVGVVAHVRSDDLAADGREKLYVPYRQEASRDVWFVVRSDRDPVWMAPSIRRVLAGIDPQLPVYEVQPMEAYLAAALSPARLGLTVLLALAALAILSAAMGLYGVVALEASRRTRDFGVRIVVGARRQDVGRTVLAMGVRLVAVGTVLGAAGALLGAEALEGVAYGTSRLDGMAWFGVFTTIILITLLACSVPALRASRLDPAAMLRSE